MKKKTAKDFVQKKEFFNWENLVEINEKIPSSQGNDEFPSFVCRRENAATDKRRSLLPTRDLNQTMAKVQKASLMIFFETTIVTTKWGGFFIIVYTSFFCICVCNLAENEKKMQRKVINMFFFSQQKRESLCCDFGYMENGQRRR